MSVPNVATPVVRRMTWCDPGLNNVMLLLCNIAGNVTLDKLTAKLCCAYKSLHMYISPSLLAPLSWLSRSLSPLQCHFSAWFMITPWLLHVWVNVCCSVAVGLFFIVIVWRQGAIAKSWFCCFHTCGKQCLVVFKRFIRPTIDII